MLAGIRSICNNTKIGTVENIYKHKKSNEFIAQLKSL
jgi:hypothetical protein